MTLIQLQYFVTLAELRNFSRVAERFFVAQAAVSYQIRHLEQELGVRLFDRSTRSVQLTAAGQSLYSDIKPLLENLFSACERAKMQSERTQFRIAYSRVCFGERFNRLIDMLSQELPDVEMVLYRIEPEDNLFDALNSDQIDAALFFNPYPKLPETLEALTFGIYDQVAIISELHRFANKKIIHSYDIDPNEILACEGMRRIEKIRASAPAVFDNKGLILPDLDSVFAMVKSGRGVACLPVIDDVNITGLRYIPIDDPENCRSGPTLTFSWKRGNTSRALRSASAAVTALFQPRSI